MNVTNIHQGRNELVVCSLPSTTSFDMSQLTIQLTRKQQEMLLRGLRYVRSSVALDNSENWSEALEQRRQSHYSEVAELESLLNGATIVESATVTN